MDTSRTTQDKSRTSTDQTLQLLVDELEDLGRNTRSIAPAALAGCSCLFACRAVKSRVRQRTSEKQLQQAAHEALQDAIASLPTPDDQLIGQAILGATDDFVGDDVNTRKRTLDELHGIDAARFKRRRPAILRLLAEYLQSNETKGISASEYRQSIRNLTCLFEDTANLGLYCLAYEFVTDFDKQLSASEDIPQYLHHHRDSITGPLYDAYLELILSAGYCLSEAPYSCRTTILNVMPAEIVPGITVRLDSLFETLPFKPHMRADFCRNRYVLPPDLYTYRSRLYTYGQHWGNWERYNLNFAANDLDALQPIVTGCGELLQYVHDSLDIDLFSWPPSRPVQAVVNYYGVEPTCILKDKSLEQHCQDYILPDDPRRCYELMRM
jgi:hypothetical protein